MKTIIAGSRSITDIEHVKRAIEKSTFVITEVVTGLEYGPDLLGKEWAIDNNIPVKEFPSDWETNGRKAGIIRNKDMIKYAESLIAIWDGESRGTKTIINLARIQGLKIYVEYVPVKGSNIIWHL